MLLLLYFDLVSSEELKDQLLKQIKVNELKAYSVPFNTEY